MAVIMKFKTICTSILVGAGAAGSVGSIHSAPPLLQIHRETNRVILNFTGKLQSAPSFTGPWTNVAEATSPVAYNPSAAEQYYRVQVPAGDGLFSSDSVVSWVVTGPLQTHFNLAFAGSPDGIVPPRREKPFFDGSVTLDGKVVPVTLRVRGNSSLQECPFPKLKLKVAREDRTNTPFADAREIKIGTHCAEGGQGNIGRLRDERAAYREALAYEIDALLGFPAPRVRRAQIEYRDTSPTNAPVDGGWVLTRKGFVFEDVEVIAERLGGRALDDAEVKSLTESDFSQQLLIDLHFLHTLLGNWDYALSLNGEGFWNTDVVELADGTRIPVVGDFDLASLVTEVVRSSAPRDFHPEWPELDREMRYRLEELAKRVKPEVFDAARNRFTAKRAAMQLLIQTADVDDSGRINALKHLTVFFAALEAINGNAKGVESF